MDAHNKEALANSLAKDLAALLKGSEKHLPLEVYKLFTELMPIITVDMIPCRFFEGRWQLGFIVRNTGLFKGKLWIVGGRVNLGESIEEALNRNMESDLMVGMKLLPGLSWFNPAFVLQYYHQPDKPEEAPLSPDFGHEPSKHCVSLTYLVELEDGEVSFGATAHGGQEASGFNWYYLDELPPKEEFAYGGYETTILRAAQYLRSINI